MSLPIVAKLSVLHSDPVRSSMTQVPENIRNSVRLKAYNLTEIKQS